MVVFVGLFFLNYFKIRLEKIIFICQSFGNFIQKELSTFIPIEKMGFYDTFMNYYIFAKFAVYLCGLYNPRDNTVEDWHWYYVDQVQ